MLLKGSFGNVFARALVQNCVRSQSTVPEAVQQPDPNVPVKRKPYSPFQNTGSKLEYALARVDDLLNWGRKVDI